MTPIAHLSEDSVQSRTLCGLPWEDWQDPTIPTDAEIGFEDLSYGARVAVRQSDVERELPAGTRIEQCQACWKAAMRREPVPF